MFRDTSNPSDAREAGDFLAECDALYALLDGRPPSDFALVTQFKGWTLDDVLAHLHVFDVLCELSISDPDEMKARSRSLGEEIAAGRTLTEIQRDRVGGLGGQALLERWHEQARRLADRFAETDPRARVPWGGAEMSARSSLSARLMETWAHGQAVYDRLGLERVDTDRIRSVAVLGVNTFAFCFRIRRLEVPTVMPHVILTAPSGERWEWIAEGTSDRIEGGATEFCQVVAQTRSIADTRLRVEGAVARQWMSIAQCFAGPPEDPPAPGSRTQIPIAR